MTSAGPEQPKRRVLPSLFCGIAIVLGAVAVIAAIRNVDWTEDPASVNIASLVVLGLGVVSFLCWVRWYAPASLVARRWLTRGLIVALIIPFVRYRIEGVSGSLDLRLRDRWAPKPDAALSVMSADEQVELAASDISVAPTDSPQFFGLRRDGVVRHLTLDTDWVNNPPRKVWRQSIGVGWSSFAIAGRLAVTMEQRETKELVAAYDVESGRPLWMHGEELRFTDKLGGDGPRATPAIHDGFVYAVGATGILNCLEATTGRQVWRHELIKEYNGSELMYGFSASPLVVDDTIVLSVGGPDEQSVVAFDLKSGKERWRAGGDPQSYSSPTLMTLHGKRQIVVAHSGSVAGYDPEAGKQLWNYVWRESGNQPTVSQPIDLGDGEIFLSKGYGVGCILLEVEHVDGAWSVQRHWRNTAMKTKFSSPVLHKGQLYGLDDVRLLSLDPLAAKGRPKINWKVSGYDYGQVLCVGDVLLIQSEQGELLLVDASAQEHRELARIKIFDDKTWSVPAIAGSRLIMRNDREAACYELPTRK